jgi:hypothetical protein
VFVFLILFSNRKGAENAKKTIKRTLRSLRLCGSKKPVLQTKGVRNSNLTHSIRTVRNFRTLGGPTNFQLFLTAKSQRMQRKELKTSLRLSAPLRFKKNQYYKLKELELATSPTPFELFGISETL